MGQAADPKTQVLKARGREGDSRGCLGRLLLLFALLLGLAGAGWYYLYAPPGSVERLADKVLSTVDSANAKSVSLYFADPQWTRLVAEKVTMSNEPDKGKRIAKLVELLARGPSGDAAPVLPPTARVRQVYMGANGLTTIDLEPGLEELKGQGAAAEMLSVFALVHTITQNVDGISSVRILVGGKEVETLAGNVNISEPLRPRPELVGTPK